MGPLSGVKVVEFEAIGPTPFAGMLLADMGADVILIDRPDGSSAGWERWYDVLLRGRRSVTLDLKSAGGREAALKLMARADAAIEGFRPGVMERLGLGPETALQRNPRLVYGRATGWGQDGPLAQHAGHDINYIALTGILNAIGRKGETPVPPLNLVGDFGGGGMLLGFGVACALFEAQRSGQGQVIDAAMVEGASLLAAMFHGFLAGKRWSEERGVNTVDAGAPWYGVYETKDGKHVALGAIERQFFERLVQTLGLGELPAQHDRARWAELKERLAAAFKSRTRDEWCAVFEGADACFAPVLSFTEAPRHPHSLARQTFIQVAGIEQPAPAPRFSRTPGEVRAGPPERAQGGRQALRDWGFSDGEIAQLAASGVGAA